MMLHLCSKMVLVHSGKSEVKLYYRRIPYPNFIKHVILKKIETEWVRWKLKDLFFKF